MKKLFLISIILIGVFLRCYKLDWGDSLFPHPDERNIAGGIMNLSYPTQMNPKFFAYGGFPLYLYYFTGYALNAFLPKLNLMSFDNVILIGRYWSAFFSSLTLVIFYLLCKKFISKNLAVLAVLLLAFIPGVIQQAHFATVETLLSFFLVLITYLIIKYLENGKKKFILLASIIGGLAVGTKMSALLFLPPIFFSILLFSCHSGVYPVREGRNLYKLLKSFFYFLVLILSSSCLVILIFIITNPFIVLDYQSFRSTMNYETGVGLGNPIVFYTRQFEKTIPVIFQFTKIFPYALGPSITIFAVLGFILFFISLCRDAMHCVSTRLFFIFAFLLYLIPNLIIFAKWTRFVSPVFPFFVFFAVYFFSSVIQNDNLVIPAKSANWRTQSRNLFKYIFLFILLFSTIFWGLAFFSIYTRRDIRHTSSDWMIANLKPKSQILFETGNVIDVPLGGDFTHTSYDFFHIDQDNKKEEFFAEIEKADYFLIQSRRVWADYTRIPETHPTTAKFYDLLWSGKLGFEKIAEFDSFPQIFGIKFNDELAEETFTVFDHPHMSVWRKVNKLTINNYKILFD